MSALFNLALLSVVTFYQMAVEGEITATTNLSAGITFCTFSLIILHHAIKRLLSLRRVEYVLRKVSTKLRKIRGYDVNEEVQNEENVIENKQKVLTHTSVEMCEPLIAE